MKYLRPMYYNTPRPSHPLYIYHVTGVDTTGRRFKLVCRNYMQATSINLYRGSVWEVHTATGKRKRIKQIWN